jgi:hypothetical protein
MTMIACIYCGSSENLTDDHIPPKNLFPEPRTSDLITVPACQGCNKSYEKDDEYFRVALTVIAESLNPVARDLWLTKVVGGTLRRSPAMKYTLLETLRHTEFRTPAGVIVGRGQTFRIKGNRVNRVVRRIVSALHWLHHGAVPSGDVEMIVAMSPDLERPGLVDRLVPFLLGGQPMRQTGAGVFRYAFDRDEEIPAAGAWLLVFYSAVAFLVTLTPPELRDGEPDSPTR